MTSEDAKRITFVSRPSAGDYLWNAAAVMRSSAVTTAIGTFGTATAAPAIVLLGDIASIFLLLGGLSFLTGVFVVPFMWWSIHQRRDLVLAPVQVVADEAGISFTTATTTARHDWSVFRRVRERPGAFLFDTGVNVALLIATRDVADRDVRRLRSLLVATGTLRPQASGTDRLRLLVGVAVGLGAAALSIFGPLVLGPS
jgi:hypothetical protein